MAKSTKFQQPSSSETPNFNHQHSRATSGFLSLVIGHSLVLGAWNLVLPVFPTHSTAASGVARPLR
jgi:hypothetical protein